jgi:hypothetical protein
MTIASANSQAHIMLSQIQLWGIKVAISELLFLIAKVNVFTIKCLGDYFYGVIA